MRILLIEDDKALCRVLQPTLQAAGFASDCCHTGADGLHLLKTGYYDACIPVSYTHLTLPTKA